MLFIKPYAMSTTDLISCSKHSILPSGRQFLDPSGIPQVSEGQNICKKKPNSYKNQRVESDFYGASEYVFDFKYVIQSLYYSFIHTFSIFTYSYSRSLGGSWISQRRLSRAGTIMQIHTCRQFAAFGSPDLHFCEWEETGGNPYKHNNIAYVQRLWYLPDNLDLALDFRKPWAQVPLSLHTHTLPEIFSTTTVILLQL